MESLNVRLSHFGGCGMIVDSGGKAISALARALLGRFVARREAMLRWCLG